MQELWNLSYVEEILKSFGDFFYTLERMIVDWCRNEMILSLWMGEIKNVNI